MNKQLHDYASLYRPVIGAGAGLSPTPREGSVLPLGDAEVALHRAEAA